jgi:hypothetical protein
MDPENVNSSAIADHDRGSEKNSEGCADPATTIPSNWGSEPDPSFSAQGVLSVPSGPSDREIDRTDDREIALCEEFESTHLHPAGIELESDPSAVSLETRGTTSQKPKTFQRELWARQTVHKNAIAAKLREIGRVVVADQLEQCHSETTWCICKSCKTAKPFLNRCERFYCPECQPTLSRDRERSIGWWAREMQQPKHVVLTIKNFPRLNKRVVKWAKSAFSKLRRRKFASNWIGGFYNWEVTNEGKGWHLHLHALVEAKWIDHSILTAEWMKVTRGLGRIVNINDARRKDYLKEVTKYAVKGNQLAAWSGEQIAMFIDAFTGVRTFGVFGSLYAKRTEFREWLASVSDTSQKCKCGCTEFWYQSDFDYVHGELIPDSLARPPTCATFDKAQLQFSCV